MPCYTECDPPTSDASGFVSQERNSFQSELQLTELHFSTGVRSRAFLVEIPWQFLGQLCTEDQDKLAL